jgi:hypothetical protein
LETKSFVGSSQKIPDSAHCVDFDICAAVQQLTPEMVHVHRDRVRAVLIVDSIKLFFENGLCYDPTEAPHKVLEDCAFPAWQDQRNAPDCHVSLDRVEADVTGLQHSSKRPTWPA